MVGKACLSSLVLFTVLLPPRLLLQFFQHPVFPLTSRLLRVLVLLLEAPVHLLPLGDSCSLFCLSLDIAGKLFF